MQFFKRAFLFLFLISSSLFGTGTVTGTISFVGFPTFEVRDVEVKLNKNNLITQTTTTNSSGVYTFTDVPDGWCTIIAGGVIYAFTYLGAEVTNGNITTTDLALSDDEDTLSISGYAVPGATINFYDDNLLLGSTVASDTGVFTHSGFSNFSYIVAASADTYQTAYVGVVMAVGSSANMNLLQPPGSISGKISDKSDSSNIIGAMVQVYQDLIVKATTTTDSLGNYTIEGLPPGSYVVRASSDQTYQTFIMGAIVIASIESTIDIGLQKEPGTVSGNVTGTTSNQPALVQAIQNNLIFGSAWTDGNGNYSIEGLSPGEYIVTVRPNPSLYYSSNTITIMSNQTTTQNFSPSSIQVRAIGGDVFDFEDSIAGATVIIRPDEQFVNNSTLTTETGLYSLKNIIKTPYTATIRKSGFQTFSTEYDTYSEDSATLLTNPASISGTVSSFNFGQPIPAATVKAIKDGVVYGSALTDPVGDYLIEGLPPGTYTVAAGRWQDDFPYSSTSIVVDEGSSLTIDFALTDDSITQTGTITDKNTGAPIESAVVRITDQNSGFFLDTLTASDGTYSIAGLLPGVYVIEASAIGYNPNLSDPFTITGVGTPTPQNLQLFGDTPPQNLTGSVLCKCLYVTKRSDTQIRVDGKHRIKYSEL